jgi:hypothetical protein
VHRPLVRGVLATDHLFFVERLAVLRRGTIGGATVTVRVEFEAKDGLVSVVLYAMRRERG